RARLLLHGVLVVAVLHHVIFEEAVGARSGVAAVEADELVRPLTGEPKLPPRDDVILRPGAARLRKERVHLAHAQALDRVVLVDEHREGIHGGANRGGLVAKLLSKGSNSEPVISRDMGPRMRAPAVI